MQVWLLVKFLKKTKTPKDGPSLTVYFAFHFSNLTKGGDTHNVGKRKEIPPLQTQLILTVWHLSQGDTFSPHTGQEFQTMLELHGLN